MNRVTFLWASLSGVLAAALVFVGWQLWHESREPVAEPELSSLELGLPRVHATRDSELAQAESVLLWDTETNVILFERGGFVRRPLASITKLMTAMVALDYGIEWDQEMAIRLDEYGAGGQLLLHPGETVTMQDLFHASLVGSANNATLAYVRGLGIDQQEFVRMMNRKAIELGLEQTDFVDVTGLSPHNVSTAYEVARLAEHAFSKYPRIAEATSQAAYTFTIGGSGREHTIRTTNKLISEEGIHVTGSKTGYLYEAGWCLVVQGSEALEHRIAVVLGSPSEDASFDDTQTLLRLFAL